MSNHKENGNSFVSRLRQIICLDGNDKLYAQECAKVFLSATRTLKNKPLIGLNLLIGTVHDSARCKMLQLQNRQFPQTQTISELFKEFSISFADATPDSINNNDDVYKIAPMVDIICTPQSGRDSTTNGKTSTTIQVTHGNETKTFCFIGSLNYDKRNIYVQDKSESNPNLKSNQLSTLLTNLFQKLEKETNDSTRYNVKNIQETDRDRSDGLFNFNVSAGSWQGLADTFENIFNEKSISATVQILKSITELASDKLFESHTKVTVIFFSESNEDSDGYVPYTIYNAQTQKLNFLAWYSDADETGLMRHSPINETDVLSARLGKYAKMLVYCVNEEREEKYKTTLDNSKIKYERDEKHKGSYQNNIKSFIFNPLVTKVDCFTKKQYTILLSVIPVINKFVYDAQEQKNISIKATTTTTALDEFMRSKVVLQDEALLKTNFKNSNTLLQKRIQEINRGTQAPHHCPPGLRERPEDDTWLGWDADKTFSKM